MLEIIITIDYEVFEAQISPKRDLISRTDKILDLCEKYGVKITIMMEALQYKAFKRFDEQLIRATGYSPAELMGAQIKRAYCAGHDVQLHLHPQWLSAEYVNGRWLINKGRKALSSFNYDEIKGFVEEGKHTLESLIREVDDNYICQAVRFQGPVHFAPDKEISSILSENGFVVHSLADYCMDEKKGYWPLLDDNSIYEVPIFTLDRPKISAISFLKIMTMLYNFRFNLGALKKKINTKILENDKTNITGIGKRTYRQKMDFCKLNTSELELFFKQAERKYKLSKELVPLVMTGHPKDFLFSWDFEKWLKGFSVRARKEPDIQFGTFSDFIPRITGKR